MLLLVRSVGPKLRNTADRVKPPARTFRQLIDRRSASGQFDRVPTWWWEWSRCDHFARAERAARVTTGPWRTKPARRSARRDGSQREPFHRVGSFHRSVWCDLTKGHSAFTLASTSR